MQTCVSGVLQKDGEILLGLRSSHLDFYPNVWDTIGGHSREGETPEKTLSRELQEEIGVTPINYERLATLSDPQPDIHGDYEYQIYLVSEWEGTVENRSDEHLELRWFKIVDAVNLKLALPQYVELFKNLTKEI